MMQRPVSTTVTAITRDIHLVQSGFERSSEIAHASVPPMINTTKAHQQRPNPEGCGFMIH